MPPKGGRDLKKGGGVSDDASLDVSALPEGDDDRVIAMFLTGAQRAAPAAPSPPSMLPPLPSASKITSPSSVSAPTDTPRSVTADVFLATLQSPFAVLTLPAYPDLVQALPVNATVSADGASVTIRFDPFTASERNVSLPLFARRIILNPSLVHQFLGGVCKLQLFASYVDPAARQHQTSAVPLSTGAAKPPPKKGSKPDAPKGPDVGAASGAADGNPSGPECVEIFQGTFGFASLLQRDTKLVLNIAGSAATDDAAAPSKTPSAPHAWLPQTSSVWASALGIPPPPSCSVAAGFERLTLTVAVNAPLLSAPANLLRYPALLVSICGVRSLPPPVTVLAPSNLAVSTLSRGDRARHNYLGDTTGGMASTAHDEEPTHSDAWRGLAPVVITCNLAALSNAAASSVAPTGPNHVRRATSDALLSTPRVAHSLIVEEDDGVAHANADRAAMRRGPAHLSPSTVGDLPAPIADSSSVLSTTRVVFLSSASKLGLLQFLYDGTLAVELHDRDRLAFPKKMPAATATSLAHKPPVGPICVAGSYGIAEVPLRGLFDGTTIEFDAPLFPCRTDGGVLPAPTGYVYDSVAANGTAPSGGGTAATITSADYVSYGTSVAIAVSATMPIPDVIFCNHEANALEGVAVTTPDAPATSKASPLGSALPPPPQPAPPTTMPLAAAHVPAAVLSRIVILMPYEGPHTPLIIRALMSLVAKGPPPTLLAEPVEVRQQASSPTNEIPAVPVGKPQDAKKGGAAKVDPKAPAPVMVPSPPVDKANKPHAVPALPPVLVGLADHVTGVEIMDGQRRVIIMEGKAGILARCAQLALAIAEGSPDIRVLFNHELPFLTRAYLMWPPLVLPVRTSESPPQPADAAVGEDPAGGKGSVNAPSPKVKAPAVAPSKPALRAGKAAAKDSEGEVEVSAPAPAASLNAPPALVVGSEAGELDAGGVGGRLRRIRLGRSLEELKQQPGFYVRRRLSHAALQCVLKLCDLWTATSVSFAATHNYFPSSSEIVALERVEGQCLETVDITGTNQFVNFADLSSDEGESIVAARQQQKAALLASHKSAIPDVDLADFRNPTFLGRVVSFVAYPGTPDEVKGCPPVSKVATRFDADAKAYMKAIEHRNALLLCAFPSQTPPTQSLKFMVTAQIVGSGADCVLLVMDCQSTSKTGTDTRNPAFVAKLRRDAERLPPAEFCRVRKERRAAWRACHSMAADPRTEQYRDDSDDDAPDFRDLPPPTALAYPSFAGEGDASLRIQHREAMENVQFKNLKALRDASTIVRDKRHHERKSTVEQEQWAAQRERELDRMTTKRLKSQQVLEVADDRPSFTVLRQRTALEDARPTLAPSPQRVDDLKQPWMPTDQLVGYAGRDARGAGRGLKLDGAKNILGDPLHVPSLATAMTAEERVRLENEDRERERRQFVEGLVVEDTTFRVKLFQAKASHPIDKYKSLLKDAPAKWSLKMDVLEPPPISIREVEKAIPNRRVERNVSKHPDARSMYYAKSPPKHRQPPGDATSEERQSPLYYDAPQLA